MRNQIYVVEPSTVKMAPGRRKLKKQNVFDDFIAAADWLIKNKSHRHQSLQSAVEVTEVAGRCCTDSASRSVWRGIAGGWRHGHASFSEVHHRLGVGSQITDPPDNADEFKALYSYPTAQHKTWNGLSGYDGNDCRSR